MALDPELLEILACPESKKPLLYFEEPGLLYCPDSKLKYRVEDDIPILLLDEAERLDEAGHAELMARAAELGLAGA